MLQGKIPQVAAMAAMKGDSLFHKIYAMGTFSAIPVPPHWDTGISARLESLLFLGLWA